MARTTKKQPPAEQDALAPETAAEGMAETPAPQTAAETPPDPVEVPDPPPAELPPPVPEPPPPAPEPELPPPPELPPDPPPVETPPPPPAMAAPAVVERRGGGLPAFAGGAVAAALAFALGWWTGPGAQTQDSTLAADLAAQGDALAALSARVDALPAGPDLTPLEEEIAALRADTVAQIDSLRPTLDDLAARVAAVERAPLADGTLPEAALTAWQDEVTALRAALAEQAARTDALVAEAAARIDATAGDLAAIEAAALNATQRAANLAALGRIQAALETGAPFAEPLAELTAAGVAVPPALVDLSAAGAPANADLAAAFPEAARAALAVARSEGLSGEDGGGLAAFLRTQFDVRSTTPQEGTTPDAILSRAEAAVAAGDLAAAQAEIAALPEVVRAAMGPWLTLAEARVGALAAADALSQTLNQE